MVLLQAYEEVAPELTECTASKNCHNNPSSFPAVACGARDCVVNMTGLFFDCCNLSFGKGLSVVLRVILGDYLICLTGCHTAKI